MSGASSFPMNMGPDSYPMAQDATLRKMLSAEMRKAPEQSTLCDVVCGMWSYHGPTVPVPVVPAPVEASAYPPTPNGSPSTMYMPQRLLAPGIPLDHSELLKTRALPAAPEVFAGPGTPPVVPGLWMPDAAAPAVAVPKPPQEPEVEEAEMARELIGMCADICTSASNPPPGHSNAEFDWFFGGGPAPLPLPEIEQEIEQEIEKRFPSAESSPTRVNPDPDYDPREGRRARRATRGGWESSEEASWQPQLGWGAGDARLAGGKRRRGSLTSSSGNSSDAEGNSSDWTAGATSPRAARDSKASRVRNQRKCACCGATSTPQWRHGPEGTTVCNACGVASHKQKKAQAQAERAAEKAAAAAAAAAASEPADE